MRQLSYYDLKEFDYKLFSLNVLPHNMFIENHEMCYLFLRVNTPAGKNVLEEVKINDKSLDQLLASTDRWLDFLSNTNIGMAVKEYVQTLWTDVHTKIKSCSSINIHLDGNMPQINLRKSSTYRHRHPIRKHRTSHNVLTYVTPLLHMGEVTEYLSYADFDAAGVPAAFIEDLSPPGCTTLTSATNWANYIKSCHDVPGTVWHKEPFPGYDQTLRLQFNASRYSHGIDGMKDGTNIYCIVVFNDVEYHSELDEKEYVAELFDNKYFSNADNLSTSDSSDA
jgi:hypothetical protein